MALSNSQSKEYERITRELERKLSNIDINQWHFDDRRFSSKNLWSDVENPRKTIWEIQCEQLQIPFF